MSPHFFRQFSTFMWSRYFLVCCCFVFCVAAATAQTAPATLAGIVVEADTNLPLPGANVVLVGTTRGIATDQDGRFVFAALPAASYTLRVTYLGYATAEETVTLASGATEQRTIVLRPAAVLGEEVLVLGVRAQGQAKALTPQQ